MAVQPPIRKAVFPVAGLGTRILPATAVLPKELLPIVDKPIIQYGVEEAVASGLSRIVLVNSPGKRMIADHFGPHAALDATLARRGKSALLDGLRELAAGIELSTAIQDEPLGLGHAVLVSRERVGDEPFAVVLSDDVIDADPPALAQMLAVFARADGPVLLVERVPREAIGRYGVVAAEALGGGVHRVTDLVEKPAPQDAPSDLAVVGRYLLTPDVHPALEQTAQGRGGEIQLTDGLRRLLARRPVFAVELDGVRHDAGNKAGYLRAVLHFARKHPELREALPERIGETHPDAR